MPHETAGGAGGARALMLQFCARPPADRFTRRLPCSAVERLSNRFGPHRARVTRAFAGGRSPVACAIGKSRRLSLAAGRSHALGHHWFALLADALARARLTLV